MKRGVTWSSSERKSSEGFGLLFLDFFWFSFFRPKTPLLDYTMKYIEGSHIRPKTPQGIHGPTFVIPTWRWDSFFSGWSVSSIFWWFGLIWFRVGCFCLIWFVVRIRIHISILDSIICIILVVYNLGMLKIICWQNCWQKYNDALRWKFRSPFKVSLYSLGIPLEQTWRRDEVLNNV